jgi:hypothetical protein
MSHLLRLFRTITAALFFFALVACNRSQPDPTPATVIEATETPVATLTTLPLPTPSPTPPASEASTEIPAESDWPPQVIYSSPGPGQEALLDGAVTIRFDQPMDQPSVEAAFEITTADDEETAVTGLFEWPRPDTVIFTPRTELKRAQPYRVRIGAQASAATGHSLGQAVELDLQTVGFLAVSQVIPAPEQEAAVDAAITVLFNRPVVPLTTSEGQERLPQPLQFAPPIAGRGEWVATSIYRFTPDEPLQPGRSYQATVTADLTDVTGAILEEAYSWRFHTPGPAVLETSLPPTGIPLLAPDGTLTVTFNMPMNIPSTEAAIHLQPAVPLHFTWSEGNRVVSLRPQEPLPLNTQYGLVIGETAQAAGGEATLNRTLGRTFKTFPYPAVVGSDPSAGALLENYKVADGTLMITFAGPMDPQTFAGQILVEPDPGDLTYSYREFDFEGRLSPRLFIYLSHQWDTLYTVTLQTGIRDRYGNPLGETFSTYYRTPPARSVIHLNMPSNSSIGYLSTSFPSAVDFSYTQLAQVDAELYAMDIEPTYFFDYEFRNNFRPSGEPRRTWTFTPPAEPAPAGEYVIQHIELADGAALPTGMYFLQLTTPDGSDPLGTQKGALVVADTNLVVKVMFDAIYVWATDLASGQSAAGLTLTLYGENGRLQPTAVTDSNGLATLAYASPGINLAEVLVVSNAPGQAGFGLAQTNWHPYISTISPRQRPRAYSAYIYTDRPIYRPGDTVYFRGIVRNTDFGRYQPPTLPSLQISVEAWSNYSDEELYFLETMELDDNGSFSGEVVLPATMAPGEYILHIYDHDTGAQFSGSGSVEFFEVAEYRKPELQVQAIAA